MKIQYSLLIILLLIAQSQQTLNNAGIATASGSSYSLFLDKQETLLFSCGQSSGLKVYQVSGANSWTVSSTATLSSVAAYASVNSLQAVLSADENFLFLANGADGLKVVDISDKSTWTTSSVTDLSTLVVGSLSGTINSVRLSKDNYFLFVGGATGFVAYDIRTLSSWTNQDISALTKFGQYTSLTNIVDIDILSNENFALVSAGANGAAVLKIQGRSTYLTNSVTITFSLVASGAWTGVTNFIGSPDNEYAFIVTSTAGYIVDISGVSTWSSQDIQQLVVAKITETGLSHGIWINGANYLITGESYLYDLRSRGSWAAGTVSSAEDLTGDQVDEWTKGASSYFVKNAGQTRMYVALGSGGIQVLSMLQSDGWTIILCSGSNYFHGSQCFPCNLPCGSCYDQFSCSICTGDLFLSSSRDDANSCECPNGYLDHIYTDDTQLNCQAGSSCTTGQVKVNNRCLNEDCLDLSLAIDTTKIKLNVTQETVNTQTNFKFLFYYNGTFSGNTVTSWQECYTSLIYIQKVVGADTIKYYLPIEVEDLKVTSYIRFIDLESYGCVVTENSTTFSYTCTTYWVNKFFDQEQLSVQAPVVIVVSKSSQTTLTIDIGKTTTTTTCTGCDENFQVQSSIQLVDASGVALSTTQFVLGATVRFKIELTDASLRQVYYLKHVETKLATTGFNLSLTPLTRDSSVKGQLLSSFQATLAATGASIIVSSTLQTTLPTYTLLRNRMLQNATQSVVSRLNVSIVDPNNEKDGSNKPVIVLVLVSTTAVLSGLMVIYHLYESYFRKNIDQIESKKQIQRQNVFNLYQKQTDLQTQEDQDELPEKQLRRNYQLKVESLQ